MDRTISPQVVGRIGELAVEIELLKKGCIVASFNSSISNCIAYDLFAVKK